VTVTVTGFNHTSPSDVDILLVGPGGQKFILVSDVIGGTAAVAINWTFDDAAAAFIGSTGTPVSGTFKPTNYAVCQDPFAAPAPAGPYLTPGGIGTPCGTDTLGAFSFVNPIGTWSLYVVDDLGGNVGTITGGWSLNFTVIPPPCPSPTPTPTATPTPTPTATPTPTPIPGPTPIVHVRATPTQVHEGSTATFVVEANAVLAQAVTVNYSMSGNATLNTDYSLSPPPFQVTIPAGQMNAAITLHAVSDEIRERRGEKATITLQPGAGYAVTTSRRPPNKSATIKIVD
jgi:large repetitive protein